MIRGTTVLGVGSSAGPPSAIPLGFARGFGKTGQAFSKSARRGASPVVFGLVLMQAGFIILRGDVSHPPGCFLGTRSINSQKRVSQYRSGENFQQADFCIASILAQLLAFSARGAWWNVR